MIEEPRISEAGILSGAEISDQSIAGRIKFEPELDFTRLNPASYDLTLGKYVAVYRNAVYFVDGSSVVNVYEEGDARRHVDHGNNMYPGQGKPLDSRKRNKTWLFEMEAEGWLLKPGIGYLMHTAERICTEDFVPVLDGKSSLGRLFMTAHVTAGYGDPGFDGQYTLEVVVTQPVIVYPGMRFCQIRFHTLVGRRSDYKKSGGHYVGATAEGPVPSMSWKQFEEQQR